MMSICRNFACPLWWKYLAGRTQPSLESSVKQYLSIFSFTYAYQFTISLTTNTTSTNTNTNTNTVTHLWVPSNVQPTIKRDTSELMLTDKSSQHTTYAYQFTISTILIPIQSVIMGLIQPSTKQDAWELTENSSQHLFHFHLCFHHVWYDWLTCIVSSFKFSTARTSNWNIVSIPLKSLYHD